MEHEKEVSFIEEKEGENVIAKPEEKELLVIKRALNVQRITKDEQRQNIFHSRCSIQGKVYSLIMTVGVVLMWHLQP